MKRVKVGYGEGGQDRPFTVDRPITRRIFKIDKQSILRGPHRATSQLTPSNLNHYMVGIGCQILVPV